jgi:hypothetical protein
LIAEFGPLAALSWGVVVVGAFMVIRLASKPPFRRDLAALPVLRTWLIVGGLAAAGTGIWLMVRIPAVLHVAALGTLIAMCVLWWRARPSYGRRRRWPPGSLGIGASLDAIDNRDYYLQQAAQYGQVFKMSQFGRPVLCVVGLARGREPAMITTNESRDKSVTPDCHSGRRQSGLARASPHYRYSSINCCSFAFPGQSSS